MGDCECLLAKERILSEGKIKALKIKAHSNKYKYKKDCKCHGDKHYGRWDRDRLGWGGGLLAGGVYDNWGYGGWGGCCDPCGGGYYRGYRGRWYGDAYDGCCNWGFGGYGRWGGY